MKLIHPQFLRLTFILGLLSLISVPASVVSRQQRSREEVVKEAGRLATEAERTRGEAIKNFRAGDDDAKIILEAEKAAAESVEKAIELWREAGDDNRLKAGVEELTRIYSIIGEYDRVVDGLTSEAEYWRDRGKVAEQAETLFTLGTRQWQMQRNPRNGNA